MRRSEGEGGACRDTSAENLALVNCPITMKHWMFATVDKWTYKSYVTYAAGVIIRDVFVEIESGATRA